VLILGSDQLRNLATWQRWRELLAHAHMACTQRERVPLTICPEPVEALVRRTRRAAPARCAGRLDRVLHDAAGAGVGHRTAGAAGPRRTSGRNWSGRRFSTILKRTSCTGRTRLADHGVPERWICENCNVS
jgi:hypothetical protein